MSFKKVKKTKSFLFFKRKKKTHIVENKATKKEKKVTPFSLFRLLRISFVDSKKKKRNQIKKRKNKTHIYINIPILYSIRQLRRTF